MEKKVWFPLTETASEIQESHQAQEAIQKVRHIHNRHVDTTSIDEKTLIFKSAKYLNSLLLSGRFHRDLKSE